MPKSSGYELIIVICNAGYSSLVMEAANASGARGGTVMHARGTANKEAEEFFHISIQPEKDAVLLVVPSTIKDNVLHAVYQKAGLDSDAQGIAFSITVNEAVGLKKIKDIESKQEVK